jgi:hypothetical protein
MTAEGIYKDHEIVGAARGREVRILTFAGDFFRTLQHEHETRTRNTK